MLTPKQKQILDYIKGYIDQNGFSPTFEEISRHTKKAFSTVHEHVETLIKKGFLIKKDNSSRGIELKEQTGMVKIPLHIRLKREIHRKIAYAQDLIVKEVYSVFDKAVLHEAKLGKEFIYQGYKDTTCLVELDESPPESLNHAALETALQIALMLNCQVVDEVIFMRKTVIDGSNTGGFQRSVMIAKDGCIDTKEGKVRIKSIVLEEDAARIISKEKLKQFKIPI